MKFDPMKPAPPVTRRRTLASRHVPDVGARIVPGQPSLVAGRRFGTELDVDEINDPPDTGAKIAHAVGNAGRDANQPRAAISQHEPHLDPFRRRSLANVEEDEQHAIGGRHVPDVGLADVEMVGLDDAGLDLAVVDLAYGEAG